MTALMGVTGGGMFVSASRIWIIGAPPVAGSLVSMTTRKPGTQLLVLRSEAVTVIIPSVLVPQL